MSLNRTEETFGRTATIQRSRTACVRLCTRGTHLTVIWGDLEDGQIAVNSAEGRIWPENVRRDPEVSLVVVNGEHPYEYVSIRGRVVEDTHEGADQHIDRLSNKYLGRDEYPFRQPGEERVKFLIEPEWVSVQGG